MSIRKLRQITKKLSGVEFSFAQHTVREDPVSRLAQALDVELRRGATGPGRKPTPTCSPMPAMNMGAKTAGWRAKMC